MDPQIRRERHLVTLHLFTDLFELFYLLLRAVGVPDAEIYFATTVFDMIRKEPVERRDSRVPGIDSVVRMAVVARSSDYLLNIRWHLCTSDKRFFGNYRRIREVRTYELADDKRYCQDDDGDLQNLFEHLDFVTYVAVEYLTWC